MNEANEEKESFVSEAMKMMNSIQQMRENQFRRERYMFQYQQEGKTTEEAFRMAVVQVSKEIANQRFP